jgi:hypothetical protein
MGRPAEIGRLARRGSITGTFCFAVVTDAVSGSSAIAQRMGFMKLVDKLEHDDALIVTMLDRRGRYAMDVASSVKRLAAMGVRVHCLALGGVDLTSPAGRPPWGCRGRQPTLITPIVILGFTVSVVQNPTISLEGDVAATNSILDEQRPGGPGRSLLRRRGDH